jgi:hypothetical protein
LAVVVFAALHSERASRLRGRRPSRLPAGAVEPEPVPITRVTVIAAEPFGDEASARDWLALCGGRGDESDDEIAAALAHVNRAVAAYRASAADPHAHDVARHQTVRVRLGYGSGTKLVDGAWEDAVAMPREQDRPRVRRRMLAPEQELAGILTGRRREVAPSEELLLRARLDLDGGRMVEAAMQLRIALEALHAELTREGESGAEVASRVETARLLSESALAGDLSPDQAGELEELVRELERVVRRRRYAGTE